MGGAKLNEFIFQYADFRNNIASRSSEPNQSFPNGVTIGANGNTPQTTEQKKFQFRDDFSWHMTRQRRPRPRLQGGRELHQRAAPLHHVQHRQGRDLLHAHRPTTLNGPISTITHQRRRRGGEHPDEAVRHVLPGRLAGDGSADASTSASAGTSSTGDQRHRPDQEPELHPGPRRGQGRQVQLAAGPGRRGAEPLRQRSAERQEQLPAAHRRRARRARQRQGHRPRRLGHLHRLRLHQLERAVRRRRRQRHRLRTGRSTSDPSRPASGRPTAAFTGRPAARQHSQPEPGRSGRPPFGQYVDPLLQMPYQIQTNAGWSHEITSDMVVQR